MGCDTLTCDEHVGGETLSAWRDALLPDDEMRRIEAHAATCSACRQTLDEFEGVAQALHRQVELEPVARTHWPFTPLPPVFLSPRIWSRRCR